MERQVHWISGNTGRVVCQDLSRRDKLGQLRTKPALPKIRVPLAPMIGTGISILASKSLHGCGDIRALTLYQHLATRRSGLTDAGAARLTSLRDIDVQENILPALDRHTSFIRSDRPMTFRQSGRGPHRAAAPDLDSDQRELAVLGRGFGRCVDRIAIPSHCHLQVYLTF